ncbi:hypothetical protein [Vibrio phage vB_VmeM-Yong XC32]|nr:hypothetical protein [Vibrio phage vB_VmeM-Yong XC31]QAX96625.1 hypothetical protein [Vibrio phage vB_VmeM-Yong XC32]QAX96943.1 hypothetical protein [Vibrio phage vB_VmeM-Yong MS31]QAX97248.1 hypothetical protein [Vibrio phage vB_VmeM-Yong MS32]
MYNYLRRNWTEDQENNLLTILLSIPILNFYAAEGLSDDVYDCVLEGTGWYPNTESPTYDGEELVYRETAKHILEYVVKVAEELDIDIDYLSSDSDEWRALNERVAEKWGLPKAEPVDAFMSLEDATEDDFFKGLQHISCDARYRQSFLEKLDFIDASPAVSAVMAMTDQVMIKEGQLNYDSVDKLERLGFKHRVVERDSFGPLRCAIILKKGKLYYG